MSDRRPSKLYKCEITPTYDEAYDPPEFFGNVISYPEASPADLLAAVRRGVESGTIKGEEMGWCVGHFAPMVAPGTCLSARWFRLMQSGQRSITEPKPCNVDLVLVIPVSDDGSET